MSVRVLNDLELAASLAHHAQSWSHADGRAQRLMDCVELGNLVAELSRRTEVKNFAASE